MKFIRPISDLHLEGLYSKPANLLADHFVPQDVRDAESMLVLAGDISSKPDQLLEFIRVLEPRFAKVLFIPGNHEWYRHDYQQWITSMSEEFKRFKNVVYALDGVGVFEQPDVRFIFCTLWGDGGATELENALVDNALNDFRLITTRNGLERFNVRHMMAIHQVQKARLKEALMTSFNGTTVVVTHHMPSYSLCHPRFGSSINGGFASASDELLAFKHAPALWIHGHTHDTIDRFIGETRVVCNPAGYRGEWNTEYNTFFEEPPVFIEL